METPSSNEVTPVSKSPLLDLPSELRENVFKSFFHSSHDQPCNVNLFGLGNTGCWCADALSLTNRQLYREIRPRFYEGIRFVFNNPIRCERFFRDFGHKTEWVTSLEVTYIDSIVNSSFVRDIFDHLSNSPLRDLKLRIVPSVGDPIPDPHYRPLYLPPSAVTKEFLASQYDLLWRPQRHSLARMDSILSLTVIGNPNVEIEEAIFKCRMKMVEQAKREGRCLEETERRILGRRGAHHQWFYKVEILS